MLLVRIPFLDMMFFFVRVFFALFFATLVYLFLWWLLLFASAGPASRCCMSWRA